MTKPRFSYDERCEDLAEYFLTDVVHDDEQVRKLAQAIQNAVENWFADAPSAASEPEGGER